MEIFESSSNWIMALGKTLVHSLWTGMLFLAVLKLAFLIVRPRFAVLRYRIAGILLFLFTASTALMFLYFYTPSAGEGTVANGSWITGPVYYQLANGSDWLKICFYYSSYIYFAGIFCFSLFTASSFLHIHSIRKNGEGVQGIWLEHFLKLKEKTGLGLQVSLLESDRTDLPFLSGLIRPVIVVPAGMFTHLPFSQVEAILLHELFHLKRLDHLVNLVQRMIEILFFYNPAVWVLSRVIRREREICCDDMVLKICAQPLDYARALYQLAREQKQVPALVPAATGNHGGQLYLRIQRILNQTHMKTNIREKLSAILLLAGASVIIVLLSGFGTAFSISKYNDQPEELSEPVAVQMVQAVVSAEPALATLPLPVVQADTSVKPVQEIDEADMLDEADVPDEIDVLDEADWAEIEEDIEEAMAEAREAMEAIDWDEIKEDMEAARLEAMEEIDWDQIKEDMEAARLDAMEDIDWDQIKEDMEQAKIDASEALDAIDWEEMKMELETVKIHLDSLMNDLDLDFDFNFDFDHDFDFDSDIDLEI